MCHQHHGLAQLRKQLAHLRLQVVTHDGIECAERLVQQQGRRVQHQGTNQAHTLASTTESLAG